MSGIVVGVDGGGSQTRVMVADEAGQELAAIDAPASAVRHGHESDSAEVIVAAVREALAACGKSEEQPRVLLVGVAGVGRDPEREALKEHLVQHNVAAEVVVQTDASIALDAAFGDGPGVLLTAGTGSMCFGRGPTGSTARCGGWGPTCGDEGSGAWIGRRALSVVTAAHDGREPETALTGALLTAAELHDVPELVAWAYQASPAVLASLAPVVLAVAKSGDLRANSLTSLAVEELLLHIRTLARNLFLDERATFPLALSGGLMSRGSLLRKRLAGRLKMSVPGAVLREEDVVPVRGAVSGALRAMREPAGR